MENIQTSPEQAPPAYPLWALLSCMLRLGTFGFGGSTALIGYMQRDLVDQRKWFSESDYKLGLPLAPIMPGLPARRSHEPEWTAFDHSRIS